MIFWQEIGQRDGEIAGGGRIRRGRERMRESAKQRKKRGKKNSG